MAKFMSKSCMEITSENSIASTASNTRLFLAEVYGEVGSDKSNSAMRMKGLKSLTDLYIIIYFSVIKNYDLVQG